MTLLTKIRKLIRFLLRKPVGGSTSDMSTTMSLEEFEAKWFDSKELMDDISRIVTYPFYAIENACGYLRRRFVERSHVLVMPSLVGKYSDPDEKILVASMTLLELFFKNGHDMISWDSDELHAKAGRDINDVMLWWADRDRRQKIASCYVALWHSAKQGRLACAQYLLDISDKVEVEESSSEEENLIKLMRVRKFLWV